MLEGKNISGNLQNLVQILGENDWKLDTLSIEYINSFENIVNADELSDDDRSKLFDVIIVNNEPSRMEGVRSGHVRFILIGGNYAFRQIFKGIPSH